MLEVYKLTPEQAVLTSSIWYASGLPIFGGLWLACYRRNPTQMIKSYPFIQNKVNNMMIRFPKITEKARKGKEYIDNNPNIIKMSNAIGADTSRLTRSFIEATIINEITWIPLLPIELPIYAKISKWLISDDYEFTFIRDLLK